MIKGNATLFDGTPTSWLGHLFRNTSRCHAIAGTSAAIIVFAIGGVLSNQSWFFEDADQSPEQLAESAQLVANVQHWRDEYERVINDSKQNNQRLANLQSWLPAKFDWDEREDSIREIAKECNVQVISLERDERFIGTRVGIAKAIGFVDGRYEDICKFLDGIASHHRPVWCDSVQLKPIGDSTDVKTKRCSATITLRLPYAEDGTPAGRLYAQGKSNAT